MTDKIHIPIYLLVLDILGTLLLGFGLAEWFANTQLVPETWRFAHYPIVLVVLGVLLMLPLLWFFLQAALGRVPRRI